MIVSAGKFGFAICGGCGARYDLREETCPVCHEANTTKEAWRNAMGKTKVRKPAAELNGDAATNGAAPEEVSPAELGRRHLEGESGPTRWRCGGCEHLWTGHSHQKQCPKCHSPNLEDVGGAKPAAVANEPEEARFVLLDVARVERSPDNPRKHFDAAKLEELAATIREHGILEPLLVRHLDDGRYVVAGGERRLRAAAIAGLSKIPCLMRRMTDPQFAEVQLIENLQREDLNPIEEAEAYQRATTVGGFTQKQLADRLGIDPSQVSNRIRLLEAPAAARDAVAAGKMGTKQAELLVPWADLPQVAAKLAKECVKKELTLDAFARELGHALDNASRPVDASTYSGPKFEMTKEVRAELDIRKTPLPWGGHCQRAFNTKLWDKLQAPFLAEEKKAAAARALKRSAVGPAKGGKAREEPAHVFGKKLWEWKQEHLALQLAAALEKAPLPELVFATLFLSAAGALDGLRDDLGAALHLKLGWKREDEVKLATALWSCKPAGVADLLRRVLRGEFIDAKGNARSFYGSDDARGALAAQLGVDLRHAADAFDAEFLEFWSDKRLAELAARPVFPAGQIDRGASRKSLIGALLQHWPQGYVPPELVTVDQAGKFETALPATKKKGAAKK